MLDIRLIRTKTVDVKKGVAAKGYDAAIVDEVIRLDAKRQKLDNEAQELRRERNQLAEEKNPSGRGREVKAQLKKVDAELNKVSAELTEALNNVPNLPLTIVPVGKNDIENKVMRTWGEPAVFDFVPKDHLELGQALNILDFEAGAKVAGSKFYYPYNEGAMLEFALMLYVFKLMQDEGFTPVITPDVARSRYYLGTGYLPKGDEAQT